MKTELVFCDQRKAETLERAQAGLIEALEESELDCELHVDHSTDAILIEPRKDGKSLHQKTISNRFSPDKAVMTVSDYIKGWRRADWSKAD